MRPLLRKGCNATAALLLLVGVALSSAAGAVECERVAATTQANDQRGDDGQDGTGTGGTGILAQTGSGVGGTGLDESTGSGTAGTGIIDPAGSGSGGTGMVAQTGSGTGGTGIADDDNGGIGGTGVYGTLMAFGSVCVNGLKVDYDAETPVEVNGRQGHTADLKLGQILRVETRADDRNRARGIAIENPIAGPIDRVEVEARRVFIMGAEVQLRPDAVILDRNTQPRMLSQLKRGDYVEVSGLRRSDGVVIASRLDQRPAGSAAFVTDVAVPVGSDTFYVGRVRGRLLRGSEVDRKLRRQRVQIRGKWNPRTQTLEDASLREAPTHAEGLDDVSIQGYVTRDRKGGTFAIAGTRVSVTDASGEDRAFQLDALVSVRGRIDEDGRLEARRIVIEERGRPEITLGTSPELATEAAAGGASAAVDALGGVDKIENEVEAALDALGDVDREEIEEKVGAARAEIEERVERIDRDKVEKLEERIERVDRDAVAERLERVERVERVDRIEREEKIERIEKQVRDEVSDRIERFR